MSVLPSNKMTTDTLNLVKNATPHLALYTNNPGAGDTGTEVSGGSYARQSITFGSITGAAIKNTNTITFAGLPSANITHYGIKNAVSGGNLLVYGTLDSVAAVVSGDQVQFQTNTIEINLAGS